MTSAHVGRAVPAVLFDIDGTLVDSNYLHVHAWARAFADLDEPIQSWRVHRCIGMDSAALLEELLGPDRERLGEQAKKGHKQHYQDLAGLLRPLPGARELLAALHERQVTVVLATSAPEEELALLRRTLQVEDWIDGLTSAEDVEQAKPAPDIISVAVQRAGVPAEDALMVGDSVWDMAAAEKAGVRAIGLRSGGVSRAELQDAGALEVYDDPRDLLEHLSSSILSHWPG